MINYVHNTTKSEKSHLESSTWSYILNKKTRPDQQIPGFRARSHSVSAFASAVEISGHDKLSGENSKHVWLQRSDHPVLWIWGLQHRISRILKRSYVKVPYVSGHRNWVYPLKFSPNKIGLIYGRYLHFRILEIPLTTCYILMISWSITLLCTESGITAIGFTCRNTWDILQT